MNKLFLISIMCFLSISLISASGFKLSKGSKTISGSFALSNTGGDLFEDENGEGFFSILANPRFGIFIADNISLGGDLAFNLISQGDQVNYWKVQSWEIGPRFNYYFNNTNSVFIPYGTTAILYKNITVKTVDTKSESTLEGINFNVGAGTLIMFGKSIGLSAELSYNYEGYFENENGNSLQFLIGINIFDL